MVIGGESVAGVLVGGHEPDQDTPGLLVPAEYVIPRARLTTLGEDVTLRVGALQYRDEEPCHDPLAVAVPATLGLRVEELTEEERAEAAEYCWAVQLCPTTGDAALLVNHHGRLRLFVRREDGSAEEAHRPHPWWTLAERSQCTSWMTGRRYRGWSARLVCTNPAGTRMVGKSLLCGPSLIEAVWDREGHDIPGHLWELGAYTMSVLPWHPHWLGTRPLAQRSLPELRAEARSCQHSFTGIPTAGLTLLLHQKHETPEWLGRDRRLRIEVNGPLESEE